MIFLQRGQKALQRNGIVRIVDHQRKRVADLHELDSSLGLRAQKRRADVLRRYAEVMADGNGGERIVDAEPSRRRHLAGELHLSLRVKPDAELSGLFNQLQILRVEIILPSEAVALRPAGTALQNAVYIRIVSVDNAQPALAEQKALAVQIFLKVRMLIGADVILRKVGEHTDVKQNSCRAVQLQCL